MSVELKQLGPKKWAIFEDGQEIASGTKVAMEAALESMQKPKKKIFLLDTEVDKAFLKRAEVFGSQQKAFEAAVTCLIALPVERIPDLMNLIQSTGVPLQAQMESAWTFLLSGTVNQ